MPGEEEEEEKSERESRSEIKHLKSRFTVSFSFGYILLGFRVSFLVFECAMLVCSCMCVCVCVRRNGVCLQLELCLRARFLPFLALSLYITSCLFLRRKLRSFYKVDICILLREQQQQCDLHAYTH